MHIKRSDLRVPIKLISYLVVKLSTDNVYFFLFFSREFNNHLRKFHVGGSGDRARVGVRFTCNYAISAYHY